MAAVNVAGIVKPLRWTKDDREARIYLARALTEVWPRLGFGRFFRISSCRDLLFHVQELRTGLSAIAAFLQEHSLAFLGFEIGGDVLQAYRRRFPGDPGAIDLRNWHAFEQDQPDTFSGMYRFWVQKG